MSDSVPFAWVRELLSAARLRKKTSGAEAKASLNKAYKLQVIDPKPRDLPMARLKRR